MIAKTSGDSGPGVSGIIFSQIQDSFTTQGRSRPKRCRVPYPTEADVWKQARNTGLVVDMATDEDRPAPRPVPDNDYEIRPCRPDPHEDPASNQAEAEREAEFEFLP